MKKNQVEVFTDCFHYSNGLGIVYEPFFLNI